MRKNNSPSPDIGKLGNTKGETSTDGGIYPFLPKDSSYAGRIGGNTKAGQQSGSTIGSNKIPFLPDKPK